MAELKTQQNDASVIAFLDKVEPDRKQDCLTLLAMMRELSGCEARMWGTAMVGFGRYHYRYESGREGAWFQIGFAPRKQNLTLYLMGGFAEFEGLLARLGKHKIGKSCLYIKRLEDVDLDILKAMITESLAYIRKTYPTEST